MRTLLATLASLALLQTGCVGRRTPAEGVEQYNLSSLSARYRPGDARPPLPALSRKSQLSDIMRFAILNNPKVEAAYFDWAAAVDRITVARSAPDPRLTFETDITDTVMSLMPGLMVEVLGPGKLRAAGDVKAAESRTAYLNFEREILRTALAVKTAYYRLRSLEESLRVTEATLRILRDLEQLAQQQNAAGRGTLQDVLRAQIAREQVETKIVNLKDSRRSLVAEFKAALGLDRADADPPVPENFESSRDAVRTEELIAHAFESNPDLRIMRADVARAEASIALARKSKVPDFSFGLEVDVKADPTMFRPSASMTLPIWRDKVAAEIAAAQRDRQSAEARLTAEQVKLAAELASTLFMYREALRNELLLGDELLPRARQSLDAAQVGYVNARSSFLDVLDAQRTLLDLELERIEARTQRELALANLSLVIAGVQPTSSPILEREESHR
jgi:cobalt-zinc-cadmium efflux system outer membrane protein